MVGSVPVDPRTSFPVPSIPLGAGGVQGNQARVRCELDLALGNDPGPAPTPSLLSDVQVFLRRY